MLLVPFMPSRYNATKQAVEGVCLAGLRKGVSAMIVIPLSPYEAFSLMLTVILIYVTWKGNKSKNTKK